jgi:ribosomal protein S18 acetylase RimI-like enzyme
MLNISQVNSEAQIEGARSLIREYTGWIFTTLTNDSNNAPTFEGLEEELATLPGIYAPPAGRLLLATQDGQPAGCVCLKRHDAITSELKRLYVRPAFRGQNIGEHLVKMLVEEARQAGYRRMVLDSHVTMKKAHAIYQGAGFKFVSAPEDFPVDLKPVVVFMELELSTNR